MVTREEYLYFLTYALEYRAMVMEQLSHEMEEDYLRRFPREDDRVDGYGVILLDYTIRDLKGISLSCLLCVLLFPLTTAASMLLYQAWALTIWAPMDVRF